ncbi:hypothetical protein, partial [Halomonas sp. 3D7M]
PANRLGFLFARKKKTLPSPYNKAATSRSMHRTSHSNHRTVIPEPLRRHSRVGLSEIDLDLGLQQPETPAQHGFPLRACGNDEGGAEV